MADPIVENFIEERIGKLSSNYSAEEKALIKKAVIESFENGTPIRQTLGMSDADIESMYRYASNLFKIGKYSESIIMMQILSTLDPQKARYPFAIAAAYHKLKQYENAVTYYLLTGQIDKETPLVYFHAADCLLQMNEIAGAIFMLGKTMDLCEGHPEHDILKNRAKLMADNLSEKFTKDFRDKEKMKLEAPAKGEQ